MTRLRMLLIVAIVGVLVLGISAGCGPQDDVTVVIECYTAWDCPDGWVCEFGVCAKCTQVLCCRDYPQELRRCNEDGYCAWLRCDTSKDCQAICPGEWECDEHGDCVKAAPTPTPEPECTKDEDCCSDYAVEKCDEDDNCVAFECDTPKQCKEVCPGDWDCLDHVCVPWLGPPPDPGCSVDADCDEEEECIGGLCVEAEAECTANQDCENLYGDGFECHDGECAEAGPECTANQDCENLYGDGFECHDGECVEAKPEEPTPEPACTEDAGCGADEECVDGECVEAKPEEPTPPPVLTETKLIASIPPLREGDVVLDPFYVVPGTLANLQHWYLLDPSVLLNTLQQQSVATGSVQDHRISVSGVPPGPHFVVVAWHGPEGGPVYYILVAEFDATGGLVDVHLVWLQGST